MSKLNVSKQESSRAFRRGTLTVPVYHAGNVDGELGWTKEEFKRVGATATPW